MTNKTAATRYARALLDVGVKEKANLEQLSQELGEFVDLFTQHPSLAKVLLNPAVPVQRKTAAVNELLQRATPTPMVAKLIALLAERDRLVLLPDVLASYRERLLDHQRPVAPSRCPLRWIPRSLAASSRASAARSTTAASRASSNA